MVSMHRLGAEIHGEKYRFNGALSAWCVVVWAKIHGRFMTTNSH